MTDNFEAHFSSFISYVTGFIDSNENLSVHYRLKKEHTLKVVENAKIIAAATPFFCDKQNALQCYALLLSALYHDIGRFEQLRQYQTFADALSCDHGTMGAKILREKKLLTNESSEVRRMVMTAVFLHNKFAVPATVRSESRMVLSAIRDADKLDILRVLAGHLGKGCVPDSTVIMHLKDKPMQYTPFILNNLGNKGAVSFLDMEYVNDFRLLLCHWVQELEIPASLTLLRQNNYLLPIIDGMEGLPLVQEKARNFVDSVLAR